MSPLQAIPQRWRQGLYAGYVVTGPVMAYALTRGWITDAEMVLYAALGTATGLTALANTSAAPEPYDARHDIEP